MYLEIAFLGSQYDNLMRMLGNVPKQMKGALREACKRAGGTLRSCASRELRGNTFVRTRQVGRAIGKLKIYQPDQYLVRAIFRVSDKPLKAQDVKLFPARRTTARKGKRSVTWPKTGFQVSSRLPVKYASPGKYSKGQSHPFIYFSKKYNDLAVAQRGKKTGSHTPLYPQYTGQTIASILSDPIFFNEARNQAAKTFETRLEHEIDYRLGLGR